MMPDIKAKNVPLSVRLENYLRVSAPGDYIAGKDAGTWLVDALKTFQQHISVTELILEEDRLEALTKTLRSGNKDTVTDDTRLTKAVFILMRDTSFLFIASGDTPKPVMLLTSSSLDRLREDHLESFFLIAFGIRDTKDAHRMMRKWEREAQLAEYRQKLHKTQ
jgi:hypothetical protein